ncbi:MAG TPA: alpha-L-arabinofuranosidase C-terminal domain-containing protein [Chitinophagaceae bacterium]|nr:alpha-L-arabinofuranosidase C-terminal domain-containing protein [Chitinophagaceae bacterium]
MLRIFFLLTAALPIALSAQNYSVNLNDVKAPIQPTMWGLFFEDINRGADGGMYAELVKNRSFDFPKPMTGWETWPKRVRDGVFIVTGDMNPDTKDPKWMTVTTRATDTVGLINEGFDGIYLKNGLNYTFTLQYRQIEPGIHVRVFLFNTSNRPIASASITLNASSKVWQEQQITIIPGDSASKGKLLVIFEGQGKLDVDRISLFPTDTWQNRPGGLRNDLVQKLADLKPGFLRFPGGCIVEGNQLVHRYQWKNTVGPLNQRLLVQSIWADDVPNRQTPDYMESFGLGFLEYFQLCEDIGAAPMPIINCGMSCQFDAAEIVPLEQLQPFIQDALDLIEFANGDVNTTWGAKRAAYGHPAPFNMKILGVGNENWGPQYVERLDLFTNAIKEKYPFIQIVNATGYSRNIPVFTYMDSVLRKRNVDIIDEHFYDTPNWFMSNSNRYDNYDRKGPKIFVGEFAAQTDRIGSQKNVNNLIAALSEACFMTGLERNADVVTMASYAPLFAHVDGWQWTPNLIWFDNARSYNTPSYYVQQLFSVNKGTNVVSMTENGKMINNLDSIWASAVIDKKTNELIIKIVNPSSADKQKTIEVPNLGKRSTAGIVTTLKGEPGDMNRLQKEPIVPATRSVEVKNKKITFDLEPWSFSIIKIRL